MQTRARRLIGTLRVSPSNFLRHETPDFISLDLWPPNIPDLNPLDYKICDCLQQCVYKKPIRDLVEVKQRLAVCADFEQTIVDKAIDQ